MHDLETAINNYAKIFPSERNKVVFLRSCLSDSKGSNNNEHLTATGIVIHDGKILQSVARTGAKQDETSLPAKSIGRRDDPVLLARTAIKDEIQSHPRIHFWHQWSMSPIDIEIIEMPGDSLFRYRYDLRYLFQLPSRVLHDPSLSGRWAPLSSSLRLARFFDKYRAVQSLLKN